MKIAAAEAIAALAREDVPDEVAAAYRGRKLRYGPDYLIPTPFDPRLITRRARRRRQGRDGDRRRAQADRQTSSATARSCARALDPTAAAMQLIFDARPRAAQARRLRRGRGGEVIRAALAWRNCRLRHARS